ncbi:MAG: hypothetical protein R3336_10380, partial [Phycisphaeraceae bacterium]|nr:hypothetical protein [Phycisphaeraceae bacterium]
MGEADWIYERSFKVPQTLLDEDRVVLAADGLDTFAKVEINGKKVAETDNMHRRYRWDVKKRLSAGENTIRVTFTSVNEYTRKQHRRRPFRARVTESHEDAYPGWVRKQACNFGWDWGPILVSAGIWRSIRLEGHTEAKILDVAITQTHGKNKVDLDVACEMWRASQRKVTVRATLRRGRQVVAEKEVLTQGKNKSLGLKVKDPELWWPAGMGDQPLYDLTVEVVDKEGEVLDRDERRIGLRTIELDRHSDKWGESFQFVANGKPFFAKGANWIPADALISRRTREDYRRLIEDSADVHMNMLRVWGGGIYEDDAFFEICDELGICVWQDFMFACMGYPADEPEFLASVRAEAEDNVRRIRHHASLALWCGNNELEQQAVGSPEVGMSWDAYR